MSTPQEPPATVGAMDPRTAGILEMVRGLGTTGSVVGLAVWLLLGKLDDIETRLEAMSVRLERVADQVTDNRRRIDVSEALRSPRP